MIDRQKIINQIRESADVKNTMIVASVEDIEKAAEMMVAAVQNGNKILWCGNGGSAADAQHMAAELMGGLRSHDRPAIQSIALTTDTSFITAWANDTGDVTISIPSDDTQRIQEGHLLAEHILCEIVEKSVTG